VRELYKSSDLVADIERRRFEWLEHEMRIDQTMVGRTFVSERRQERIIKVGGPERELKM
jgi:hypothetical protein